MLSVLLEYFSFITVAGISILFLAWLWVFKIHEDRKKKHTTLKRILAVNNLNPEIGDWSYDKTLNSNEIYLSSMCLVEFVLKGVVRQNNLKNQDISFEQLLDIYTSCYWIYKALYDYATASLSKRTVMRLMDNNTILQKLNDDIKITSEGIFKSIDKSKEGSAIYNKVSFFLLLYYSCEQHNDLNTISGNDFHYDNNGRVYRPKFDECELGNIKRMRGLIKDLSIIISKNTTKVKNEI